MTTTRFRMALLAVALTPLAASTFHGIPPVSLPSTADVVISNVTVIDGSSGPSAHGVTVVVSGRRIASIRTNAPDRPDSHTRTIDGTGKYLIPGLWDMHVHLAAAAGRERLLEALVTQGVTSVRDMGTNTELIEELRARIASGTIRGPRIKSPGFMIESPRSLQFWDRPRARAAAEGLPDPFANARRLVLETPGDADRVVDSVTIAHGDFVKVIEFTSSETFAALVRAAASRGLRVAGHAPVAAGISARAAAEAGMASVEHDDAYRAWFTALSDADRRATFAAMREHAMVVVPTMVVTTRDPSAMAMQLADTAGLLDPRNRSIDPSRFRQWRSWWDATYGAPGARFGSPEQRAAARDARSRVLREMHDAGVHILPGTDLGTPLIYPGFSLHDELELLVSDAGFTPQEAVQAATRWPAEFFHLTDSLGTIAPGMLADLVLLDADPTLDIRNIRRVSAVIADGRVVLMR